MRSAVVGEAAFGGGLEGRRTEVCWFDLYCVSECFSRCLRETMGGGGRGAVWAWCFDMNTYRFAHKMGLAYP